MATFTDCTGKVWTIKLTLGSADRLRAECGIDVAAFAKKGGGEELLDELFSDPGKLARACYLLAGSPADYQAFADAIDGDTIEAMGEAIYLEIGNFSSKGKRHLMAKALEKTRAMQPMALEKASKMLEEFIERKLSGESGTDVVATSEPIPTA